MGNRIKYLKSATKISSYNQKLLSDDYTHQAVKAKRDKQKINTVKKKIENQGKVHKIATTKKEKAALTLVWMFIFRNQNT